MIKEQAQKVVSLLTGGMKWFHHSLVRQLLREAEEAAEREAILQAGLEIYANPSHWNSSRLWRTSKGLFGRDEWFGDLVGDLEGDSHDGPEIATRLLQLVRKEEEKK